MDEFHASSPMATDVVLEFNIVNRIYPDGKTSYNTVAEIPGTDKADEMIMLGGHLDSCTRPPGRPTMQLAAPS